MLLFVFWIGSAFAFADDKFLDPRCKPIAETLASPKFVGHDLGIATEFLKQSNVDYLKIVVIHPQDHVTFDLRRRRIRLYVDNQNQLVSAECG